MNKIIVVVAVLGFMMASPPSSLAAKIVVFPVVPLSEVVSSEVAATMSDAVWRELDRQVDIRVVEGAFAPQAVSAVTTEHRSVHRPEELRLREAREVIARGTRHVARLRFRQAASTLVKGIAAVENIVGAPELHGALPDAYLQLAIAYLRQGKTKPAVESLEAVVRLDPTRQLERGRFPPLFLRIYNEIRVRLLAAPRGRITVVADVPGGSVWVDGRRVGEVPATVEDLVAGTHRIGVCSRLAAGGCRGGPLEVLAGREASFAVHFGTQDSGLRLRDALKDDTFHDLAADSVASLAAQARASFAVILVMDRRDNVYRVGGLIGDLEAGVWSRLRTVTPRLTQRGMAMAAHTLALDVGLQLSDASGDVVLAGGEPVRVLEPRVAGSEGGEAFALAELTGDMPAHRGRDKALVSRHVVVTPERPAGAFQSGARTLPQATAPALAARGDGLSATAVRSDVAQKHLWHSWWFWTALGAGAAVVAGGTWVYIAFDGNGSGRGRPLQVAW